MDLEKSLEDRPFWTLVKIGAAFVTGLFLVFAVLWGLNVVTFFPRQAAAVAEKTFNADNVIYNYEWFHRQRGDILAIDAKVAIADMSLGAYEKSAGPRSEWTFGVTQEWNRLNAVAIGLKGQRADMVAEYNARASMSNRSIFMGSDLPNHIE